MPKKKKNDSAASAPSVDAPATISPSPEPTAKPPRKRVAARKSTSRKSAGQKETAAATGKKTPAKTRAKKEPPEPTDAEISLRAYFIAEHRTRLSLPGDQSNDWLEARRQLVEEARQRRA